MGQNSVDLQRKNINFSLVKKSIKLTLKLIRSIFTGIKTAVKFMVRASVDIYRENINDQMSAKIKTLGRQNKELQKKQRIIALKQKSGFLKQLEMALMGMDKKSKLLIVLNKSVEALSLLRKSRVQGINNINDDLSFANQRSTDRIPNFDLTSMTRALNSQAKISNPLSGERSNAMNKRNNVRLLPRS
jgi:hypothetical protein